MLYARAASGYRPGGPRFLPLGLPPPPGFTNEFGSATPRHSEISPRPALFDRVLTMSGAIDYIAWPNVTGFLPVRGFCPFANTLHRAQQGFELAINPRTTHT